MTCEVYLPIEPQAGNKKISDKKIENKRAMYDFFNLSSEEQNDVQSSQPVK
jgi:hypothetical protein